MPWLRRRSSPHPSCPRPPLDDGQSGDVWGCLECGRRWRIEVDSHPDAARGSRWWRRHYWPFPAFGQVEGDGSDPLL